MSEFSAIPGYVSLTDEHIATVFDRSAPITGCEERLHACFYEAAGGLLRPSILSDKLDDLTQAMATVRVMNYGLSVVVDLSFEPGVAPFVGRPIMGWNGEDVLGDYGDAEGTEQGYGAIEAVAHLDGTAVLIGAKTDGTRQVLTGVTEREANNFIGACIGAVNRHRSQIAQAERIAAEADLDT